MTQPRFIPPLARRATRALLALLPPLLLAPLATPVAAQTPDPACFPTAGGALEICRGGEAEGVFFAPRACESASNVQIVRIAGRTGRLQAIYQAEAPVSGRRRGETCPPRRAVSPLDGGSVRAGAMPDQLATLMPPTEARLWEMARAVRREERSRRRGRERMPAVAEAAPEGIAARHPMVVAGRDWSGDDYTYVFLLTTVPGPSGNRHALMQARTADFERFDIRGRDEGGTAWVPFTPEGGTRRRSRRGSAAPAAVLDETGAPIVGRCPGEGFDRHDLVGSISVVDRVYHYFYTDVLPADCDAPIARRRLGLYLRTSRDLTADRPWSSARLVAEPLPGQALIRVAKAKGMDRWAVAYSCNRPANTMDGPVADLCVQVTADLAIGSLAGLTWYSEPTAIMRSPAYLGLRSGGDGSGRYGRAQHFWMTDRYGNLDTPGSYPAKAGFLTWLDRLAPGHAGPGTSSVFGRPVYWGTWSVRPVEAR